MSLPVALVSGANQGIGYAIVKALAAKNVRVLLGSRDLNKGIKAASDINQELNQPNVQLVEAIQLDIDSDDSVNQAARSIEQRFRSIQILVNNAGIAAKGSTFDAEIARWTLKTNYYGLKRMHAAFQPLLAPGARVVNVSSTSGQSALQGMESSLRDKFLRDGLTIEQLDSLVEEFVKDVENNSWEGKWPRSCYGVSKAAVTMFTRIYARDHHENDIVYSSCCPGYVSTSMSSYKGHKTIEEGAKTPLYLAFLPSGSPSGKFWRDEKETPYA